MSNETFVSSDRQFMGMRLSDYLAPNHWSLIRTFSCFSTGQSKEQ